MWPSNYIEWNYCNSEQYSKSRGLRISTQYLHGKKYPNLHSKLAKSRNQHRGEPKKTWRTCQEVVRKKWEEVQQGGLCHRWQGTHQKHEEQLIQHWRSGRKIKRRSGDSEWRDQKNDTCSSGWQQVLRYPWHRRENIPEKWKIHQKENIQWIDRRLSWFEIPDERTRTYIDSN